MISNLLSSSSLLSCSNSGQLADFCSLAVPSIWGPLKPQPLKRTIAFKQFCQKLFKATQISYGCVVLGLYYIHRLRSAYPYIHSSIGSEVRLFTIALVLANKYLDDNTFTNKTWSEVSSIPVSELNIMEMEFLSALNYNIHLPYDQYFQWVGQCQQWISPTSIQKHQQPPQTQYHIPATPPLIKTPVMPLTPSVSTINLKRSHYDGDDEEQYFLQSKRRSTYSTPTQISTKMPYTPPESFQFLHSTTMNDDFCRPILSWSSSSSALNYSRPSYASTSALSAPVFTSLHYSTSLLATRVRGLEID